MRLIKLDLPTCAPTTSFSGRAVWSRASRSMSWVMQDFLGWYPSTSGTRKVAVLYAVCSTLKPQAWVSTPRCTTSNRTAQCCSYVDCIQLRTDFADTGRIVGSSKKIPSVVHMHVPCAIHLRLAHSTVPGVFQSEELNSSLIISWVGFSGTAGNGPKPVTRRCGNAWRAASPILRAQIVVWLLFCVLLYILSHSITANSPQCLELSQRLAKLPPPLALQRRHNPIMVLEQHSVLRLAQL